MTLLEARAIWEDPARTTEERVEAIRRYTAAAGRGEHGTSTLRLVAEALALPLRHGAWTRPPETSQNWG